MLAVAAAFAALANECCHFITYPFCFDGFLEIEVFVEVGEDVSCVDCGGGFRAEFAGAEVMLFDVEPFNGFVIVGESDGVCAVFVFGLVADSVDYVVAGEIGGGFHFDRVLSFLLT